LRYKPHGHVFRLDFSPSPTATSPPRRSQFTFSSPLCWTLGRFRSSAHRRPPSPFKKLEGSSRGRSVPGSSAPSVRPPPRMSDEARRGPAGAAQVVLRASSEDRKPVGSGSPPPAATATAVAHKIQLKSADMKEEMRQEAFEIARIVRTLCPCSRSAFFLRSIWFPSLPLLTGSSLGMAEWDLAIWGLFCRFLLCRSGIREAQYGEGHRGVHKEGVRQEPRPNLALHRRPQLR
jgi:hypothetical protein